MPKLALLAAGLLLAALPAAGAETRVLIADRDATLIEDPQGALASGAGGDLYLGRTGQAVDGRRRLLVHFDLSGLPRDAAIESVRLKLRVTQSPPRAGVASVHRLRADWGEGASVSLGGGGAPALPGDATWLDRFHGGAPLPPPVPAAVRERLGRWDEPGGDFDAEPLASAVLTGSGEQVLAGEALTADVQRWLRNPGRNFGWLLLGEESAPSTARRFASRENLVESSRPRLEVVFTRR